MTDSDRSDPAHDAVASPEALAPSNPVYVVGIGPGDPAFLTPRGRRRIADADIVLGFESVVERVSDRTDGTVVACGYDDEQEQLTRFAEAAEAGARATVVMTGDPNVSDYQFLGKVERAVDRPVRVVPGISSIQVAASRARTPMEETTFATLHKRGPVENALERLRRDVGDRHLIVLPRPYDWTPERIAEHLLAGGASPSLDSLVFERLTREDETVTRSTLGELAQRSTGGGAEETTFSDLSILVVRREAR